MEFINNLPIDYYKTKIISEFTTMPSNIDYNTPFYRRNPEYTSKLTLNHLELIEYYVRLLKPKNFIELGTQFGELPNKILPLIPNDYYAVDIETNSNLEYLSKTYSKFNFSKCTTDLFFNNLKMENTNLHIEMALIDAWHSHEASYNDFLNLKDHMVNDGIIFFHDTYPISKYWTDPGLCYDAWKTPEKIRKEHNNEFEILTVSVNPGISIARKVGKQLEWLNA